MMKSLIIIDMILLSIFVPCSGFMWSSSWDSNLVPDFSLSPGIDEFAVPSVIVAGIPKGGTTDFWSVVTSVDPSFRAYSFDSSSNHTTFEHLEKEFNTGFVSGVPLKSSCPANAVQDMLKCPMRIGRDNESPRNMTKCYAWFADENNKPPKYTIDANPYLMRESNPRLFNIIELNKPGSYCRSDSNTRSNMTSGVPLVIGIIREPMDRSISYFNYFLCRTDTIPLELMLEIELGILSLERFAPYLQALKYHHAVDKDYSYDRMFEIAHVIISAYRHVLQEMEKEIAEQKKKYPGKKFEQMGLLLDSIYLPQLLALIFQRDKDGNQVNSSWPMMVLQSEFFFGYREEVMREAIIPYFHPKLDDRPLLGDHFIDTSEGIKMNIHMRDSPLKNLSDAMKSRVEEFYFQFDKNLIETLYNLQQMGRIFVVPKIKDPSDRWWKYD